MELPVLNDKQKKVVKRMFKRLNSSQTILTEAQDRYAGESMVMWDYLNKEFPELKNKPVQINSSGEFRKI